MSFDERLRVALALLERTGLSRFSYAPYPHRLLWRLRVPIAPPHFARFATNFAWSALLLLLFYGAIDLLKKRPPSELAYDLLFACALGLVCALSYAKAARDAGLPAWSDVYSPEQPLEPTTSTLNLR